jgi:hypothetical protein
MIGQRDIGQKTGSVILQGPQGAEVLDAVLGGFDVAVQHGAVGGDSELVGHPVHPEPFFSSELPLRYGGPNGGAEHLRSPAGQTGKSCLPQGEQHLALRELLDPGQVGNLHRGERLYVNLGMPLFEPPDHFGVVAQPQLGMQPTDDMKLAGRHSGGLLGFLKHLIQRAGVGALLLRHPGKGAEGAGVPQYADVGRIDVLVGGKEDPISVAGMVGKLGQHADPQQIGRGIQGQTILPVQPHAGRDLLGNRTQQRITEAGRVKPTSHISSAVPESAQT